jgi:hypothetical protein
MDDLPIELWELIFGHKILHDYSKVLRFVNKRVNRICSKNINKKTNVMNIAARDGYFELVKWLRKKRCIWDERTCSYAAKGGKLRILKWLRKKNVLGICGHAILRPQKVI